MSRLDYELLDRLTAWMQQGGFTRLTFKRGKSTLTLHLPRGGAATPAVPPRVIRSPGMGLFTTTHPLAEEPYVTSGDTVKAGDILALLRIGPALLPVGAPLAGVVRAILPREGDVIGFDDPLFEIEPREGQDAD